MAWPLVWNHLLLHLLEVHLLEVHLLLVLGPHGA
jgi:hypothetical protein